MGRLAVLTVVTLAFAGTAALADDYDYISPPRRPDETLGEIFHGPFRSSRLFAMPTADVIGAYMMSVSGDGSLLQQPGVLTSAGVLAIGFGDIAQLEYRHTSAISVTGVNAPLPAAGVQVKIPIPEYPNVPVLGIALRLGVNRSEQFKLTEVDESVSDFYIVMREPFTAAPWLTLHAGTRISSAKLGLAGDRMFSTKRTLVLPTAGVEFTMNREAKIIAEVAAAPQFHWSGAMVPGATDDPTIGYGMLGRLGFRWNILPSVVLDGTLGYQMESNAAQGSGPRDIVQEWDIRLGAEVFVPWGALACRATGAFCGQ